MSSKRTRPTWSHLVQDARRRRAPGGVPYHPRGRYVPRFRFGPRIAAARRAATGEVKFFDTGIAHTTIATAGDLPDNSWNHVVQGITESNRIGRKITISSINCRFRIEMKGLAAGASLDVHRDTVRVIILLDKQANGAVFVPIDVLEDASYLGFNNLTNSGRFRTLMDRHYDLDAKVAVGTVASHDVAPVAVSDTFFYKCSIPIEFSAAAGVMTEIRSNNVNMLVISRNGLCRIDAIARIRFTDG